jgi:cardiolipin synthase
MLRARASVGVVAFVATMLLAVTGCKIDTPAAASAGSTADPAAQGPGSMGDTTVENALVRAAKRGVDVQVCGENEDGEYDSAYAKLARARIHISYYSSSTGFYIHGKVIEADYGTGHARMFVGSENFSRTSLDDNRELGLIISDHAALSAMARTFAADFRNGHHWS